MLFLFNRFFELLNSNKCEAYSIMLITKDEEIETYFEDQLRNFNKTRGFVWLQIKGNKNTLKKGFNCHIEFGDYYLEAITTLFRGQTSRSDQIFLKQKWKPGRLN